MSLPSKQILLVGGGGLGVLAALNLESNVHISVTLVARSNYSILKERGYEISSCDHGELRGWRPSRVVNKIPNSPSGPFDYIVIATKNIPDQQHVPSMAEIIFPAVTPAFTRIVLIQNGLNIELSFFDEFPQNVILSGVSYAGSHEVSQGVIVHGSHDMIEIGAFHNPYMKNKAQEDAAAKDFVDLYSSSGKATCRFTSEVRRSRWKKLVYNASMNPLCAITGLDTGSLRQAGSAMEKLLRDAMGEIMNAAKAAGYSFDLELIQELLEMDPVEGRFRPSMLQDVEKGRLIEYENLVGEPLREGIRLGVPMPTISVLYGLCQALQARIAHGQRMP